MQRILITGSNRGIGLELVEQYLKRDDTQLFATCRNPGAATDLNQLAAQNPDRVSVIQMDVNDQESIERSATVVGGQVDGLDILINNAGINPNVDGDRVFGKLDFESMLTVLRVNSVAPVLVAQAYADLLCQGDAARLINVSSGAGSLTQQANGCNYSYNASKSALNMYTRCLSGSFKADNVVVTAIHPGWVRTDMGGANASLSIPESAQGVISVIDALTMADNGAFLQWDGETLPW